MTDLGQWDRSRREITHSWLKNTLLLAISRVEKQLTGETKDDCAISNLLHVLSYWPEVCEDLRALLEALPGIQMGLDESILSDLPMVHTDADFALKVTRLCAIPESNAISESVEVKMAAFDLAVARTKASLTQEPQDSQSSLETARLLQTHTMQLSEALSDLGRSVQR